MKAWVNEKYIYGLQTINWGPSNTTKFMLHLYFSCTTALRKGPCRWPSTSWSTRRRPWPARWSGSGRTSSNWHFKCQYFISLSLKPNSGKTEHTTSIQGSGLLLDQEFFFQVCIICIGNIHLILEIYKAAILDHHSVGLPCLSFWMNFPSRFQTVRWRTKVWLVS